MCVCVGRGWADLFDLLLIDLDECTDVASCFREGFALSQFLEVIVGDPQQIDASKQQEVGHKLGGVYKYSILVVYRNIGIHIQY